jgi:hypothetical protein
MSDAADRLAQAIRDVINEAVRAAAVRQEHPTPPPVGVAAPEHRHGLFDLSTRSMSVQPLAWPSPGPTCQAAVPGASWPTVRGRMPSTLAMRGVSRVGKSLMTGAFRWLRLSDQAAAGGQLLRPPRP